MNAFRAHVWINSLPNNHNSFFQHSGIFKIYFRYFFIDISSNIDNRPYFNYLEYMFLKFDMTEFEEGKLQKLIEKSDAENIVHLNTQLIGINIYIYIYIDSNKHAIEILITFQYTWI